MTYERSAWNALVCALGVAACSSESLPAPARTGTAAGSGSEAQVSAAAAPAPAQTVVVVNPNASAAAPTTGVPGCGPGRYAGTYGDGAVLGGPLEFDLVVSTAKPAMTSRCEEFCPEIGIGSDGGEFSGSWLGIEGHAKVVGGLDCRTGEFRAQLLDGYYGSPPTIDGSFILMAATMSEAMFSLTLDKP
jgi:hypothetical protein